MPTPPTPVSVTNRRDRTSSFNSFTWASRPTRLDISRGRFPGTVSSDRCVRVSSPVPAATGPGVGAGVRTWGASMAMSCSRAAKSAEGSSPDSSRRRARYSLRRSQRLALAAAAVQGQDQDPPRPLPARMVGRDGPGLADGGLVAAQRQQDLGAGLAGVQSTLLQPGRLPSGPPFVAELGVRVARPAGQRPLQPRQRPPAGHPPPGPGRRRGPPRNGPRRARRHRPPAGNRAPPSPDGPTPAAAGAAGTPSCATTTTRRRAGRRPTAPRPAGPG